MEGEKGPGCGSTRAGAKKVEDNLHHPREGQAVGGGGKTQAVAVDLDRKDIVEKEEAQPGNLPGGGWGDCPRP
jgi:hypothetical protein